MHYQPHLPDDINRLLEELEQYQHTQYAHASLSNEEVQDDQTPPLSDTTETTDTRPHLHVYIMSRPLEEQLADLHQEVQDDAIESMPHREPEPEEAEVPITRPASWPPLRRRWMLAVCVAALMCVLGALAYTLFNPFETSSATITIVPAVKTVTSSSTITLTPVPTKTAAAQLAERMLPRLTLTQVGRSPTTGVGHQSAQAAHGTITFYNAAPYAQTVAAGTWLTGADGVQIVTDADATLPAAVYPVFGQSSVLAQSVQTGPAGNIAAADIYGPCCRLNVSAVNGAFRGGQDARTFPMVTQSDLDGQTATLKASLMQSVTAAMQTQLHMGEALITPVPCTPTVTPDHAVGSEATQLTVTIEEQCLGEAYNAQALQQLLTNAMSAQAAKELGACYQLVGTVQTSITQVAVTNAQQGTITLQAKGVGQWAYQVTDKEAQQIIGRIAGKSKQQATMIVAEQPGVQAVTISITGKETTTLPTDVSNIHLLLLATGA